MKNILLGLFIFTHANVFAATSTVAEGKSVCLQRLILEQLVSLPQYQFKVTQVSEPFIWGDYGFTATDVSGLFYDGTIDAYAVLQNRSRFNPTTEKIIRRTFWVCILRNTHIPWGGSYRRGTPVKNFSMKDAYGYNMIYSLHPY